jgi:formamidopyrimidine-DNA glycosylase
VPELPEVETLRRALVSTLVGREIVALDIRLPKMFEDAGAGGPEYVRGARVVALRRRAKYLIWDLSEGRSLVIHLRLAGQVVHRDREGVTLAEGGHPVPAYGAPLPHKSTHILLHLDDRSTVYLTDIRQFGRVWHTPTERVETVVGADDLGPEPLDDEFTLSVLRDRIARRGGAQLKPLLLDQSFVGGVGNIYADEIVFAARLTPATRAGDITRPGQRRLFDAIRSVLGRAVEEGVAEILNGKANPDRDFPRVHGREGQACLDCGTTVVKFRFAGRGTYTCPRCQKYPQITPRRRRA